jgi:hypothetical protein
MRWACCSISSTFFALIVFAAGCSDQEVSKIEKVTGKAWDKAQAMTQQAGAELGVDLYKSAGKWEESELLRRVRQRLQWDQNLRGSDIKVQIEQEEIILTGKVRDENQRQRAVQLAESTDGVQRVKETLQIVAE